MNTSSSLFSISSLLQTPLSKPSPKATSPNFLHQLNLLLNSTTQLACKPKEIAAPLLRHSSSTNFLNTKLVTEDSPLKGGRRKSAEGTLEVQFSKLGKEREDSISPRSASSRELEGGSSSSEAIHPPNPQMNANQWYNYMAASMAAAAASQQQQHHQQMQLAAAQASASALPGMPMTAGWGDLGRLQPWLYPYANAAAAGSFQHHHHKSQHKRKGGQIRFTNEQTDALENTFDNHKYLSNNQRKKLAKSLVLSERQVKTWFQNRRAKHRRNLPSESSFSNVNFALDSLEQ